LHLHKLNIDDGHHDFDHCELLKENQDSPDIIFDLLARQNKLGP